MHSLPIGTGGTLFIILYLLSMILVGFVAELIVSYGERLQALERSLREESGGLEIDS